jgi:uncharacterized membrane protein
LEALLIVLGTGLLLLIPVGSVLGFLAFRHRGDQSARISALHRELLELRQEFSDLKQRTVQTDMAPTGEPDEPADVLAARYIHSDSGNITPERAVDTSGASIDRDLPAESDDWRSAGEPSRIIQILKENWMVWLGGLSVALAGIFMVSHSINTGLIGPALQFALALATGCALHAAAEFLRRRHMGTDQVFAALAGGGSVTLYAALLAGIHHYQIIGPVPGLILLAVVSLSTMALALVHGPLLAVMGLSGAYLVPLLVGDKGGSIVFLLSYSFLITLSSLLLMRYVYRDWLWHVTLAGALLWWLLSIFAVNVGPSAAWYLAALFVAVAVLSGKNQIAISRLREGFLLLLGAWGLSIAFQPADDLLFLSWLLILPAAILVPFSRDTLWYLPWVAVLASAVGWLVTMGRSGQDVVYLVQVPLTHQSDFLAYLISATVLMVVLGFWRWLGNINQRRWASLTLLSPLIWLILGWLLLLGYGETSVVWAVTTLLLGAIYGALAWRMETHARYQKGVVWALLAAHVSYSLATVMAFREASLTLALSVQFVSLSWLARRYQMPELYLLLKGMLALVVARLTFNPWLQSYDASVHWSLWTYGGATLFAATAIKLADKGHSIRPWLEAATLHLLVLFLGAELRYWLYDGDIFTHQYGFIEATLNTLLWGALCVTYAVRAKASQSLVWLYHLFSKVLLILSGASYLTLLTLHNPWWSESVIGSTPVFNMLLLAFGGPALLAFIIGRFPEIVPRLWSLGVATAGFLLFTALEIRQLWQGSDMALWYGTTEGELYTYSVIGMLYAIAAIIYSAVYSAQSSHIVVYKAGMTLLGIVIGKIFLIDMAGLQGFWRVAAFMGLGLALLGLAWIYRKAQHTSIRYPLSNKDPDYDR